MREYLQAGASLGATESVKSFYSADIKRKTPSSKP
jgi:hypothetical protein